LSVEVRLRPVEDTDLPIFFQHQLDPDAIHMAAFTHKDPSDRDAFDAHWRRIRNDTRITTRTILVDGRVVGHVATFVDDEFGKQEVTYWIGKEHWGRGIATRALSRFLLEFTTRPIYGRAAKDNLASIRVMEKCGFRITGQDRGFANARGKEIDEVILELDGDHEPES
jgi:RimJ/RimL family protein N-acetyltransferase